MKAKELTEIFNLSPMQESQFKRYFELLVEWNEKINLTAITEESEVYLKHFYDSLALIKFELIKNEPFSLLDIGAGAGFPSIPMKILYPHLRVTIIDSLAKRIKFLSILSEELELEGVTLLHGRAEDFGQDKSYRASYDYVTARAVARLNVLIELTLPFLKKSGKLYSLKASQFEEELAEAQGAIKTLGCKFEKSIDYQLLDGSERHVVVIKKTLDTPNKYPRRAGIPSKKPLI
ncbi:MAG: 16S rRNA (guanine(527)-N(7))-methyltransferase RsmG [Lactovum sp.]